MSAKLTYNEKGLAMVFLGNNNKPWWWEVDTSRRGVKDIGYLYPDQRTAAEALEIISDGKLLSYSEAIPVYNGSGVDGYKFVVNDKTNKVISVVSDKYRVQQPMEFAKIIDGVFGNTLSVDTFGTLDEGRLLFCTTSVGSSYFNDSEQSEMKKMISFLGSCDYTTPFRVCFSSIRTVCWNTFTLNLNGAKRVFSARHTTNMNDNIETIQRSIGLSKKYWESLDDVMRRLSLEKVRKEDVERFSKMLFDFNPATASSRVKNNIRNVFRFSMIEAQKHGLNRAAFINGATEFVSHPERRTFGTRTLNYSRLSQEVGARLGESNDLIDKAFRLVTSDLALN